LRQQHLVRLSTVFIIITSERTYHNVVSVAELAPDDYLIKPFTAE
jgi:DNA-binding response OmpR family regulator